MDRCLPDGCRSEHLAGYAGVRCVFEAQAETVAPCQGGVPRALQKRLDIEEVRRLSASLGAIDMTEVRPKLGELIVRLRHAGIAVSDRRAVKQFARVKASVDHWKGKASVAPPPSLTGK